MQTVRKKMHSTRHYTCDRIEAGSNAVLLGQRDGGDLQSVRIEEMTWNLPYCKHNTQHTTQTHTRHIDTVESLRQRKRQQRKTFGSRDRSHIPCFVAVIPVSSGPFHKLPTIAISHRYALNHTLKRERERERERVHRMQLFRSFLD
jgi:hypothetical protein